MTFYVQRDDGEAFGPFPNIRRALYWTVSILAEDSGTDDLNTEPYHFWQRAVDLENYPGPQRDEVWIGRAMKLVDDIDWIVFTAAVFIGKISGSGNSLFGSQLHNPYEHEPAVAVPIGEPEVTSPWRSS